MAKEKLERRIHIRLSQTDLDLVHQKMTDLGYSKQSDYFRSLVKMEDKYVNLYRILMYEFKKQGSNLNQIAHKVNTTYSFQINSEVLNSLIEIERTYKEILDEIRNLK
ncbi:MULTISPECIES: plasmid mobilization relaxosome protein MobC [Burkholderiaceae]|nr:MULTISPECIES: plasmid mobilization relaxosome protein MobC [Burkholderiaceae]MBR8193570.1 plasmid mobilization relaxosome protein MobC [Burkholderia vietnamiensis]MBU9554077.1 MobC family plasmid mobilization relaxosome protein [Burkholderia multivorans]MBY4717442.1 MobC family plasmid mobilization relaxosome protein [Ralstonia mannitolilytica]HDR8998810.1 plasmid mobilization relaxosome protein MobC [Burkholderia vietnamiensis]